jgi:rfaE bifunctional protein kinase chain/domain
VNEPAVSADGRRLLELVERLAEQRVAVFGDVLLDEYLLGRPTRLSREAPVPVLAFSGRFCRAGGAANPAVNARAVGANATIVGLAGRDASGDELVAELERAGLSSEYLVRTPGRQTILKLRLLAEEAAQRHHLARLDYVADPPSATELAALEQQLERAVDGASGLLLSDYKGGAIDKRTIAAALGLARRRGLLATVDSQGDLAQFAGFDLVKCNLTDARASLGRPLESEREIEAAGQELLERLGARSVVLTRGADGLSCFGRGAPPCHLSATNRTEVFDVTGAGDTVIALLTLGLLAGASLVEAAELANLAAGLVVRRLGVATTTQEELRAAFQAL